MASIYNVFEMYFQHQDDWNQLEDILNDLDEIDKKTFNEDGSAADTSAEAVSSRVFVFDAHTHAFIVNKNSQYNPCENHECGWGKECVLTIDNQPECECRKECPTIAQPDEWDKVCYYAVCNCVTCECVGVLVAKRDVPVAVRYVPRTMPVQTGTRRLRQQPSRQGTLRVLGSVQRYVC